MQEIVVGSRQKINLETWERRVTFHFFKSFTEPYHDVCLRVHCTETYRYAKQHHLSVFLSLLHRSLVAAHQVENFKIRIVGGAVWSYEQINAGSAVVGQSTQS
jgi:chloramphenicol O-acetyltransferase type A